MKIINKFEIYLEAIQKVIYNELFSIKTIYNFEQIKDASFPLQLEEYMKKNNIKTFKELYDNKQTLTFEEEKEEEKKETFKDRVNLFLSGEGYTIKNSNYFVFIEDLSYAFIFTEKTFVEDYPEAKAKNINSFIDISFDSVNSFSVLHSYKRVDNFSSNQEKMDKLFSFIFYICSKYSEDTIFSFKSKLELDEEKKKDELVSIERAFKYIFSDFAKLQITGFINRLGIVINCVLIPKNIYINYLTDLEKHIMEKDGYSSINSEAKNFISNLFASLINKKLPEILQTEDGIEKLKKLVSENESFKNFLIGIKPKALKSYMEKLANNFLRNRMYKMILSKFGIKKLEYISDRILFSKKWE
jgi:hypothetical protein